MNELKPAASAFEASKVYGERGDAVRALDGVTIEFAAGEFSAIMGPSGSGKSTLMHCMAGLDTLSSGNVFLNGADISSLTERELTNVRRRSIGFVFQSFNLIPTLSAYENIVLPALLDGKTPDEEWVGKVVAAVGLEQRLSHRPSELSGGQQQRVAVARALSSRPAVVFADEPTGNLDSTTGTEILTFMRNAVKEMGQTIIMVTHDPVAASFADRIVFLADGKIAGELRDPNPDTVLDYMKSIRH